MSLRMLLEKCLDMYLNTLFSEKASLTLAIHFNEDNLMHNQMNLF
jgi:hypothetical protein